MMWLFLPVTVPAFVAGFLIRAAWVGAWWLLIGVVLAKDAIVCSFQRGIGGE